MSAAEIRKQLRSKTANALNFSCAQSAAEHPERS